MTNRLGHHSLVKIFKAFDLTFLFMTFDVNAYCSYGLKLIIISLEVYLLFIVFVLSHLNLKYEDETETIFLRFWVYLKCFTPGLFVLGVF